MNKAKLKSYAPQARKDFIAAVTTRANQLGLSEQGGMLEIAPAEKGGDVVIIAGQPWPAKVQGQREQLIKRIQKEGFAHTMDAVAYTWFNRFAALRYMEIHDYLGHGHRALSSREGGLPEILTHAADLAQSGDLPGLNVAKVTELKLAGNKDGELYKMLLVAQCNALSRAMPFLFERIDDETELLLPDNLLRTDSIIAKVVAAIPEEDWQQVEIIGWLYQFYISEKKDEVIGKVVKSEDIPAATQLFTPNWIVQYLVQNSVGRLWLMANPASTLKSQWPYYIQPAEQTPEVQAQLDALIQTRMSEDGGSLNPETITMLDPACGSGHILVVAYDVLKAIYLERGYQPRAIPRLILEKNLYGLDIDDRAAQLAGFALLMKARADDRRLLDNPPKLNVLALQESKGLNADEIIQALQSVAVGRVSPQGVTRQSSVEFGDTDLYPGTLPQMSLGETAAKTSGYAALTRPTIAVLIDIFVHAKTFGSLIQITQDLNVKLAALAEDLQQAIQSGDLYAQSAAQDLLPLVRQALMLGMKFDAVVANPPYMGSGGMNAIVKKFAATHFPDGKSDLFACFIERGYTLTRTGGFSAMVTMQSWMFLSSFQSMRERMLQSKTILSMTQIGFNSFPALNSKFALATAFSLWNNYLPGYRGTFVNLNDAGQSEDKRAVFLRRDPANQFEVSASEFCKIPGGPITYWISPSFLRMFVENESLGGVVEAKQGIATADNGRFVRLWPEVALSNIGFGISSSEKAKDTSFRWFPYNKGGEYRKWYGNHQWILDWENGGRELVAFPKSVVRNTDYQFRSSISWSDVAFTNAFRWYPEGFLFDSTGHSAFPNERCTKEALIAFCNNKFVREAAQTLNPTMHFHVGYFNILPAALSKQKEVSQIACRLIDLACVDWNAYERSWNFQSIPLLTVPQDPRTTLESSYTDWVTSNHGTVVEMKRLEEENNRLFIDAYGLGEELTPEVPIEQITLTVNPAYRYGGKLTVEEQWTRFRQDTMGELVSYAIGCMMGRYSLDEPGLIYAHAGNIGFDPTRYSTFPADADGIVPLTDELWFEDDAANHIREFLLATWGAETLDENMAWLAESLGKKGNETPEETIRRYLAGSFFKNHLQTYKKRPIYWLFSSGKQGAFQALVYLHRYHEGTLARMRSEYVVPLTGKIQSRIEMLTKDAEAATSTATRNKLNKEIEALRKKHVELLSYDEKLRHYADMRIQLDLDDGVKVNYGKFGDLLVEVKAVTGGASDD
ncbi:MAG: BREX-1 system adenine-specific DNA-methyltransferase PglX [Sulfuricella sp.]|nr:BREX-1 system adenine-specific DNA-methyltransferase PglX [Sulfuricella sp.]